MACFKVSRVWKKKSNILIENIEYSRNRNDQKICEERCVLRVCVHTCCHALTLLLCREDLGVAQSAVGDIPDPEAEHGVGQQELGHRCETGLPFVQVLPELHHVQDLENDVSRVWSRGRDKGPTWATDSPDPGWLTEWLFKRQPVKRALSDAANPKRISFN